MNDISANSNNKTTNVPKISYFNSMYNCSMPLSESTGYSLVLLWRARLLQCILLPQLICKNLSTIARATCNRKIPSTIKNHLSPKLQQLSPVPGEKIGNVDIQFQYSTHILAFLEYNHVCLNIKALFQTWNLFGPTHPLFFGMQTPSQETLAL